MIPILAALGFLGVLGLLLVTKKETPAQVQPKLKKFVAEEAGKGSTTPAVMKEAAKVAEKAGMPETAKTLSEKADLMSKLPKPPFPEANALGWQKFVKLLAQQKLDAISTDAFYGTFGFGAKRLQDLGLVKNVKKGKYQGKDVWTGDWVPPMTSAAFLSSFETQYKTLVKSLGPYRLSYSKLKTEKPKVLEGAVDGKALTLSGYLALAHRAGGSGALRYLTTPKERFPKTLALVRKANGIF